MNIPYIFILLEENKKFFMRILNNLFKKNYLNFFLSVSFKAIERGWILKIRFNKRMGSSLMNIIWLMYCKCTQIESNSRLIAIGRYRWDLFLIVQLLLLQSHRLSISDIKVNYKHQPFPVYDLQSMHMRNLNRCAYNRYSFISRDSNSLLIVESN